MGFRLRASINPVTIVLTLVLIGAGYAGYKFIPPYWQAQQVDNQLSAAKWEASKLNLFDSADQAKVLVDRTREHLIELGIDERYLSVYFGADYTSLHADYYVFVTHPFGKTTTLEFRRSLSIPRDEPY